MEIIEILIPVFLVLGLGSASVFGKIFTSDDSYIFSKYVFYFGFPVLIFNRLNHTAFEKVTDVPFLFTNLLGLLAVALCVVGIFWVFKLPKKLLGIMILAGIWGNVAYMGIPINEMFFGVEGGSYAAIVVGITVVFSLLFGVPFLEYFSHGKPSVKNVLLSVLKNPIVIGILLGLFASGMKLDLPVPIENFILLIAKSAGPVAIFSIGMFLVGKKVFSDKKLVFSLCFLNLFLLPLVMFGLGTLFSVQGLMFEVSVLQAAMPIAITSFILAQKYKIAEEAVSGAIVLSTLLSIVTIGLVMWIF